MYCTGHRKENKEEEKEGGKGKEEEEQEETETGLHTAYNEKHLCMFVYMYVCMYVCMYVFFYTHTPGVHKFSKHLEATSKF
jgi:hypothetical protein